MTEARSPRVSGEFITPAAAEHKLKLCENELVTRALNFTKARLGSIPRKHPFPVEKSLYDHSVEVAALVHGLFPIDNDPATGNADQNNQHAIAIATAVLHDVVEDSDVPYDDLVQEFGVVVAQGVSMLSEDNRISFVERKQKYISTFEDASTPDHIVAISLADKYINVRDMNQIYAALIKKYGDPRLAKALHYGAFWTPPAEAVQFYLNHCAVMHNRLDSDPRCSRLLRGYDEARTKWQQSLIPPDPYNKVILPEPSKKIREIALKSATAINTLLAERGYPMHVIVGGSTAYGSAVRRDPANSNALPTLNNIDLIFYPANHRGQLGDVDENIKVFEGDDTIWEQIDALKQSVAVYCGDNGIVHTEDYTLVSFYCPE